MRFQRHSGNRAQMLRARRRVQYAFRRLWFEGCEPRTLLAAESGTILLSSGAAEGEDPVVPIVQYVVQVLAPGTNEPISSILAGRDFDMQLFVEDIRTPAAKALGVFAGYTDLLYDKALAKVRVAEVQTLKFAGTPSSSFTLTLAPGQTTAPINIDLSSTLSRKAAAATIEAALNNLLGAGTVQVNQIRSLASYEVWFIGQHDVDQPLLKASLPNITTEETVIGDPTNPDSFTEAFRSRDLGLNNGTPGPFQNDLFAADASDRVDELGAFGIGGSGLQELARARFKASLPGIQTSGELVFQPNPASTETPTHDTLVLADVSKDPPEKSRVLPNAIVVESAFLMVRRALVAAPVIAALDEDNTLGVAISLLPLVTKDPAAPAGAIELRDFTQPDFGGTVVRLDPNNTPSDLTDDQVRFVPALNFNGMAKFTYSAGIVGDTISDDVGVNTVTVTVNAVNDAPLNSVPGLQQTTEDVPLIFSAANNNRLSVADIDADPAGVQVALTAVGGKLTLGATAGLAFTSGDGLSDPALVFSGTTAAVNAALAGLVFAPTEHFNGTATLAIATNDLGNTGLVSSGAASLNDVDVVSIEVAAENDPPVIAAPASQSVFLVNTLPFSTAYGNRISIADVDAGNDDMAVSIAATNNVGRVRAIAAGNAQVVGNGTFQLTILGSQSSINATLQSLELLPLQAGASGTLSILVDDLGHNPGPNKTSQTTINVNVLAAVGPFATNDAPEGLLEGSLGHTIDVLSNDLSNGTAKPTLVSFTQPAIGSVERFNNGTPSDLSDDKLIYRPPLKNGQPDLDFYTPIGIPPVVFTYVANETSATASPDSAPGTVSIRIANLPDAPVATNDGVGNSYATSIGVPIARNAAQGLLPNDTVIDNAFGDPQVASLTIFGATVASPLIVNTTGGGLATLNVDGSFSYVPGALFVGNDTFTYQAHSSLGPDSSAATVTIHVSSPPLAEVDSYPTAEEDQPFFSPFSVLANDKDDADSEPLSAVLVANVPAEAGFISLAPNGFFTYTPAPHFNTTLPPHPPISFTYMVTAPSGRESAPDRLATVSITVNETNDDPQAIDDTFRAVQHKGPLGIDQLVAVLTNDISDPDAPETFTVVAVNGALADANGNTAPIATSSGGFVRLVNFQITYTSPTAPGSDSFSYTISDGRGGTASAQVQVEVIPVFDYGDAPDSYGTLFDSDGARHLAIGPRFGTLRDEEADGLPSANANGDDLAGTSDEDSLFVSSLLRGSIGHLQLAIVAEAPGAMLDGWIDFNQDGTFSINERVASGPASMCCLSSTGTAFADFVVPFDTLLGPTVARFRVSSAGGLGPTGPALDGEVEDYVVTIKESLVVNLPENNSNRVVIRKNGDRLEVVDLESLALIASVDVATTSNLLVQGSPSVVDHVKLDYAWGGLFSPVNVSIYAGESLGDSLTVDGPAEGTLTVGGNSPFFSTYSIRAANQAPFGLPNTSFSEFDSLTFNNLTSLQLDGEEGLEITTLSVSPAAVLRMDTKIWLNNGTIQAPGGIVLGAGQMLTGNGVVSGPLFAEEGSRIEAVNGPLVLGDASSSAGFDSEGFLQVGSQGATLLDANQTILGSVAFCCDDFFTPGTLTAPNGALLPANSTITGFGTIETPHDVLKPFVNDGVITGQDSFGSISLPGYVTGSGSLDFVRIQGTLSPGAGPSLVSYGIVAFSTSSRLVIEIGGTVAGTQYDQLAFSQLFGEALIDGKLEIALINGFIPEIGDSFAIFDQAEAIVGEFSSLDLPALPADRKWKLFQDSQTLTVAVLATHPWHNRLKTRDVDADNHIVASDALDVINYLNAFGATTVPEDAPNLKPFLDVVPDNFVTAGDALEIINFLNAGLGGEGEFSGMPTRTQTTPADSLENLIQLLAGDSATQAQRRRRLG